MDDTSEVTGNSLSNELVAKFDGMFEDGDNYYEVLDAEGNDVTQAFLDRHEEHYLNGEFHLIAEELAQEGMLIGEPIMYTSPSTDSAQPRLVINFSARKTFTKVCKLVLGYYDVTFDLVGSGRVNDYSFQIESASQPTVDSSSISVKNETSIQAISCNVTASSAVISSDKKKVTFSSNFTIRLVASSGPGVSGDTLVYCSFVADGRGNT